VDNLCITRVSCGALKQPTDPPEDEAKKRARDVSRALFCRQRALAGSNLTCHRFSLRDDGGEDDASYDRLYDDPWDAFSCGVNRAREPPKTFCRIKKTILFLGKQLNFERQKPKMPAPELWRVAQSGAGGKGSGDRFEYLVIVCCRGLWVHRAHRCSGQLRGSHRALRRIHLAQVLRREKLTKDCS